MNVGADSPVLHNIIVGTTTERPRVRTSTDIPIWIARALEDRRTGS
jgi:hypothetical protein